MLWCCLQALQSIAEFQGLRQLVLADCSAVTTGGLEQLSGLVGLHYLALLRCPRVGDKGMTVLHSLTCLTYLALTGCTKVTLSLSAQPAQCLLDHYTLPACLATAQRLADNLQLSVHQVVMASLGVHITCSQAML